jgi:hypothetical protein
MNNDDDDNDIDRQIQILAAMIQMEEICLFDNDEKEQNNPELQLLKILIALKTIAYGTMPHAFLDYFQMGKTTARQCVVHFAIGICNCNVLKERFFRPMTRGDTKNVCQLHKDLPLIRDTPNTNKPAFALERIC